MKIGYAFLTYKGTLPYTPDQPVNYRYCGEFISPQSAPKYCPKIYFELPITRPVSAVLWSALMENGDLWHRDVLFSWAKFEMQEIKPTGPGGLGEWIPKFMTEISEPPREIILALSYVTEFWQPFTSLVAASKLLPFLHNMSLTQKDDFLGRIGQSRNREKFRVLLEKFYIALYWPAWEKKEMSYEGRIRDMAAHGIQISMAVFQKRVRRDMKLERRFRQ